ncbi:hypothetical protein U1Q18_052113 [Sarracenia purpurea var. burkii]
MRERGNWYFDATIPARSETWFPFSQSPPRTGRHRLGRHGEGPTVQGRARRLLPDVLQQRHLQGHRRDLRIRLQLPQQVDREDAGELRCRASRLRLQGEGCGRRCDDLDQRPLRERGSDRSGRQAVLRRPPRLWPWRGFAGQTSPSRDDNTRFLYGAHVGYNFSPTVYGVVRYTHGSRKSIAASMSPSATALGSVRQLARSPGLVPGLLLF